jgi:hypothetical protein
MTRDVIGKRVVQQGLDVGKATLLNMRCFDFG